MATVDNLGRLVGYAWSEIQSTKCGALAALPYGTSRAFRAALNASNVYGKLLTQVESKLEETSLFSLSELQTKFDAISQKADELLTNVS